MGALDGRTALVTGGGRGLGAAVASSLASAGAHVGVLARTAAEVRSVASAVGGTPLIASVDDRVGLANALQRFGDVDVLVANAGVVWPLGPFASVSLAEWEQAVAINLLGVVRVVHAVLPGMLRRGFGCIVTISSGAAVAPGMPSANAYSTSKAALAMFVSHLAAEVSGSGVTVNAVRPGMVDTAMQEYMRTRSPSSVDPSFLERFRGVHERGELVSPSEAAAYVLSVVLSSRNGSMLRLGDPL